MINHIETIKKLHKKFPNLTIDELLTIIDCYTETFDIGKIDNPYPTYPSNPYYPTYPSNPYYPTYPSIIWTYEAPEII